MEISTTESLLHPKIAKFYNTHLINEEELPIDYINDDCTYNWKNLEKLLTADNDLQSQVCPKTYNDYWKYFLLLRPVFHQSTTAIARLYDNASKDDNSLLHKLRWLGQDIPLRTVLQEHLHPSSATSVVENVLFLTSIFENGLANVYYTITNKSPPHLLRDLLDTMELKDFFGICPILFLKIIMGSPDSINLRNVAWHGFPQPSEVPSFYAATLFIAGSSLSGLIDRKQIALISRVQIKDFTRFVTKVKAASFNLTLLDDVSRLEHAIETSKWTGHSEHKRFWYQIIQHYRNERYWQFLILILPQIELILRRMYGEANNFDITAKLEEYYITMNTIFESKDNRLLIGHLSRGTLHFLYDVFISPYGMRIRDKVSHGEVDLAYIDEDLCSILLFAGFNLIASNEGGFSLDHYESRFHLNYLAFECIDSAKRAVLELMLLKTPKVLEIEFNWDQKSRALLESLKIIKPIEIFDRHKKEPEIVANLMKTAQLIVQVCENYKVSFAERFEMLLKHELRSRSRKTLEKMVKNMSMIAVALASIVKCLVRLNNLLQIEDSKWFEDQFVSTQRFCKHTLTVAENFVRYSDKESNEWLKALDCCSRFEDVRSRFPWHMDAQNNHERM